MKYFVKTKIGFVCYKKWKTARGFCERYGKPFGYKAIYLFDKELAEQLAKLFDGELIESGEKQ